MGFLLGFAGKYIGTKLLIGVVLVGLGSILLNGIANNLRAEGRAEFEIANERGKREAAEEWAAWERQQKSNSDRIATQKLEGVGEARAVIQNRVDDSVATGERCPTGCWIEVEDLERYLKQ